MIYKSVAEIFEAIDKTRNEMVEKIESLPEDSRNFRLDEASWSVTNILEHLAIVESGLVPLFFKLLKEAESENIPSDGTIDPPISFVDHAQKVNRKLEAPDRIRPQGTVSIAESLAKMEESRKTIRSLQPRLEAVDLSKTAFPHPVLGKINLYEWLAFIGLHEKRHIRQIDNIINELAVRG